MKISTHTVTRVQLKEKREYLLKRFSRKRKHKVKLRLNEMDGLTIFQIKHNIVKHYFVVFMR